MSRIKRREYDWILIALIGLLALCFCCYGVFDAEAGGRRLAREVEPLGKEYLLALAAADADALMQLGRADNRNRPVAEEKESVFASAAPEDVVSIEMTGARKIPMKMGNRYLSVDYSVRMRSGEVRDVRVFFYWDRWSASSSAVGPAKLLKTRRPARWWLIGQGMAVIKENPPVPRQVGLGGFG